MLEVGDRVIIRGEEKPLTIKRIIVHNDFKVGPIVSKVYRLYFEENHQPEFDWRVEQIIKHNEEEENGSAE